MTRIIRDGFRDALAHWPSALLLYAAVAIPALLVGYVFYASFVSAFGRSAALEMLSEGFAYTPLFDLFTKEGFRILPILVLSFGLLVVSLPLHSFLTAGLVSALAEHRSWLPRIYFAGAARHTGGFFLLSLLTLGAMLLIAILTLGAAGIIFAGSDEVPGPGLAAVLIPGIILGAGVVTLGDYSRICLVQDPEAGVFGSIRAAAGFLTRHSGVAAALSTALIVASTLPLIGAGLFEELVPPAVGGWLAPLVVVQQIVVMLRSWMRVFAFAVQSAFLRDAHGLLRPGEMPLAPSPFLVRGV
ncbi:MAG: hypothetical protein H6Q28_851 [Bacteroidetes bacterium]|nr:hypothetical protein [Bacteroidota bacterium]